MRHWLLTAAVDNLAAELNHLFESRSFNKDKGKSDPNLAWYYREGVGSSGGEDLVVGVNTQSGKWVAYMNGQEFRSGPDIDSLRGITGTFGD